MGQYRRLFLLILIMGCAALIIGGSALAVLYRGGLERDRLRLEDLAESNARLLESLAVFDQTYSTYPGGAAAGSIRQFIEGHRKFQRRGLGETGEITLARREGDSIVFLMRHRHTELNLRQPIPFASPLAEPMRLALLGQSGTMIGTDYAGDRVLAAYRPVPALGAGIVAKIDLSEIRDRFVDSAVAITLIALATIAAAGALLFRMTEPMARRLRQSETRFRQLFDRMRSGVAVFEAVDDGRDFVCRDFNRSAEAIARTRRAQVIGQRVTTVFPGIRELGLLDVMGRVWKTGEARDLPSRFYRDDRIEGWRDCFVYRLPTGEVVVLFDDATERKVAEDALAESEGRFRSTFENAAVGIAHVGLDGGWLRVNDKLCAIVGYSRDELLHRTFQEITHPDDLLPDLEQFGPLIRGEIRSYTLEKRYFHKDGHIVWAELTAALQRDETGRPLYCISIVEDIGARKLVETALSSSERRMRALLDASQDEVLLLSTAGVVLAINRAAERRLARHLDGIEPIGAHLTQVMPKELAEERITIAREVASAAQMRALEVPIGERWFEFWYYPVVGERPPVTEVAIYAREISRRKLAEREMRRLYQAIEQSPASIVMADVAGDIIYVNPKFCETTGYSRDEAIGNNPRILKSGNTDAAVYETLWATITGGEIWRGELQNRKKNGELYWELASIAPVKDEADGIVGFVAVKEDITERRATEAQLRQAQKMEAIGQLTGGIAHDFNNLLTIIIGNLQLLSEAVGSDKVLSGAIGDAIWSARRGGELTHRLLAFARRQPLQPTQVGLNSVVRGLTLLLRRTLGGAIEVRDDLADGLADVLIDTGEMERALVNLAINARDAMPQGGVMTLETRAIDLDEAYTELVPDVAPGPYVMLAVSDTGTGMPPEMLGRIFEPFFTTKPVGSGSGLGLSMVYGFVKQSGGHVNVYSEVGRGTTFKLFFPAIVSSIAAAAAGAAAVSETAAFRGEGLVALVVEDEEKLRLIAAGILADLGFSVIEAETGHEAVRHAALETRIDLLFTDLELPGGMTGDNVAAELRSRFPEVRVLRATGYSPRQAEAGDGPLLSKPYTRHELIERVAALFL